MDLKPVAGGPVADRNGSSKPPPNPIVLTVVQTKQVAGGESASYNTPGSSDYGEWRSTPKPDAD